MERAPRADLVDRPRLELRPRVGKERGDRIGLAPCEAPGEDNRRLAFERFRKRARLHLGEREKKGRTHGWILRLELRERIGDRGALFEVDDAKDRALLDRLRLRKEI